MKRLAYLSTGITLLFLPVYSCFAEEENQLEFEHSLPMPSTLLTESTILNDLSNNKLTVSDLTLNELPLNELTIKELPVKELALKELTTGNLATPLFTMPLILNSTPQIKDRFTAGIISLEPSLIIPQHNLHWSKYLLSGSVTLHQNNAFNLSLTTNIEQLKSINFGSYQQSILEHINYVDESELNFSYGVMGSYSINARWYFSGGIIHAPEIKGVQNSTDFSNTNMALVGTTYSF